MEIATSPRRLMRREPRGNRYRNVSASSPSLLLVIILLVFFGRELYAFQHEMRKSFRHFLAANPGGGKLLHVFYAHAGSRAALHKAMIDLSNTINVNLTTGASAALR